MKNRIFYLFLCLLALFSFSAAAERETLALKSEITYDGKSLAEYSGVSEKLEIEGKYAYAINLDTGVVVYEKSSDVKTPPANTVKLMTAIVAYEKIPDLDVLISASDVAVSKAQGANMSIKRGESFTARDLLYGLLVRGANDAALVLAEYVAGSEEEFCVLMNEKAEEIGALDTRFENCTGFSTAGSYTTARDMGRIAGYMYYIPELFDISNTTRYVIAPTPETSEQRTLINRNMLLSKVISQDYYYGGAGGMALGSTPEGGHCAVSTVTSKNGLTYLCVILGSVEKDDVNYACLDMASVFDFCSKGFSNKSVLELRAPVCEIPVKNAVDVDHIALFPKEDITVLLPEDVELEKDIFKEVRMFKECAYSPVNKGEAFGEVVVKYKDGAVIGTTELVADVSVDRSNVLYFLSRVEKTVTGVWFKTFAVTAAVLFFAYFCFSAYFRYFKRNKYTGSRTGRNSKK